MFKLAASPHYWWPIKLLQPADGEVAGVVLEHQFEAKFARLDEDEFDALVKRIRDEKPTDRVIAAWVLKGYRELADESGAAIPFDEANVQRLLRQPGAGSAVVSAFFESRRPSAAKN